MENIEPGYIKHLAAGPRPIPGQSLTADPDNPRPFEQPPEYVSIHEAAEFIFGNLIQKENYIGVMEELMDGRSVMELTQVTLFAGFYKGLWNPDLMLLLLEPVAYMVLALAERAGIEPTIIKPTEVKVCRLCLMDFRRDPRALRTYQLMYLYHLRC